MATIKSYTDINQSKKLAEILPLESADMGYLWNGTSFCEYPVSKQTIFNRVENIPCWSLAALLSVLPRHIDSGIVKCPLTLHTFDFENSHIKEHCWIVVYKDYDEEYEKYNFKVEARGDDIIDACYEMIIKLHELNLL